MSDTPLFVIGDIHGHYDNLVRHLRYAGLANSNAEWKGGNAQLWFTGDFTDRGPKGAEAIDYVMRLQQSAANNGGFVGALHGNHDVAILTAKLFPKVRSGGPRGTFYADWVEYGGTISDLDKLQPEHVDWLRNLPAMALVQNHLLLHADALYYLNYGETVDQVNAEITKVLHSSDTDEWDNLLSFAGEKFMFDDRQSGGVMRASQMLATYGGSQIIHGHTTINSISDEPIDRITRPYIYANGLVVDVDGGMYKGGPGFVYEVPPLEMTPYATPPRHNLN